MCVYVFLYISVCVCVCLCLHYAAPLARSYLHAQAAEALEGTANVTDIVRVEAPAGREADHIQRHKRVHIQLRQTVSDHKVVQQVEGKMFRLGRVLQQRAGGEKVHKGSV